MRVLVTGSCGWTARAIVVALADAGHAVYGFDLPDAECAADVRAALRGVIRGTIADEDAVAVAVRGAEAVVHLAVAVGEEDYGGPRVPFDTNVRGTYNVFAAARRHGVGRVVLMSEAAVHLPPDGRQIDARCDWRSSPDADHLYDLTKHLQEEIARDFCATYGMTAVVLRAGHIVDGRKQVDAEGRPLDELMYGRGGWVCRYDLAAACVQAVAIRATGYDAFHVVGSAAAHERFDIERTERELGIICAQQFALRITWPESLMVAATRIPNATSPTPFRSARAAWVAKKMPVFVRLNGGRAALACAPAPAHVCAPPDRHRNTP